MDVAKIGNRFRNHSQQLWCGVFVLFLFRASEYGRETPVCTRCPISNIYTMPVNRNFKNWWTWSGYKRQHVNPPSNQYYHIPCFAFHRSWQLAFHSLCKKRKLKIALVELRVPTKDLFLRMDMVMPRSKSSNTFYNIYNAPFNFIPPPRSWISFSLSSSFWQGCVSWKE